MMKRILFPFLLLVVHHSNYASAQTKCNDNLTCLNGGKCVDSSTDADLDFCYCNDFSNGRFVGIDCDISAPTDPADWCNSYGDFCINGGTCNEDISEDAPDACICLPEYAGRYCDLEVPTLVDQGHVEEDKPIDDSCDLQCKNSGTCEFGYRDPTAAELTNDYNTTAADVTTNYKHCQCPPGFMGPLCETDVNTCGRDGDDNPKHYCHNGATCVDTKLYLGIDDEMLRESLPPYMCNCSAAASPGKHYTGAYCEYANVKICNGDDPDVESRLFCANGGQCGRQGKTDPVWLCVCKDGFTGKYCEAPPDDEGVEYDHVAVPEYQTSVPCDDSSSKTICQNEGKCFTGVKDYNGTALANVLNQAENQDLEHIIHNGINEMQDMAKIVFDKGASSVNEHYEHCVCPSGFTGTHCEVEFTNCPSGQHVCFHGSECIDDDGGDKCSCNEDGADTALAGAYCQHKATTKCGEKFCFNGGTCDDGDVCRCPEGWRGAYCSFSDSVVLEDDELLTESKLPEGYLEKMNPDLIVISGVVAFIGILVIIVVVAMTDGSKEEYSRSIFASNHRPAAPPMAAFSTPGSSPTNNNNSNEHNDDNKMTEKDAVDEMIDNHGAAELL